MRTRLFGAIMLGFITAPAHAQLPVSLRECLEAKDEAAALHYCSRVATGPGLEENKTIAAIKASHILRTRGDFDKALALLEPRRFGADIDEEIGHVWFDQGDHTMADLHYERALDAGLDPNKETRRRMAVAAHSYGEKLQYSEQAPARAINEYTRSLALDPDYLPALLGRAEALQKLNRHDGALTDLDRAIALGADWSAYLLRARSRQTLGDKAGAIADFRRVLEENPKHIGARKALADLSTLP